MKTEKTSSEFKSPDARPESSRAACRGLCMLVSPANVLTSMRIALSGILLLLEPLGTAFYCVYALAGLTDMLDGPLARKTGTESRIGEVLDSAADLIFAAVSLVRLLPVYKEEMPFWLWAAVAFVIYLKGKNAIAGYVMNGKIVTMHTPLNRLAGLAFLHYRLCAFGCRLRFTADFVRQRQWRRRWMLFIRMLRNSTKPDTAA